MHTRLNLLLLMGTFGATALSARAQAQASAPAGWAMRSERGIAILTPSDLAAGERYSVTLFPSQAASVVPVADWLRAQADADVTAAAGVRVERRSEVTRSGAALYNTSRVLRATNGAQYVVLYFAVVAAPAQPRLIRAFATSESLLQRYQAETAAIVRDAGAMSSPGGAVAALPPVSSGTTPGDAGTPTTVPGVPPNATAPPRSPTAALAAGWPQGGEVPSTAADVDWAQALAMSLNPRDDLRPARYECFVAESARRVNPRADGLLTVRTGGSYRYESTTGSGDGQWMRVPASDGNRQGVQLSGPLTERRAGVVSTDAGQTIRVHESAGSGREMVCYLAGPASEIVRIQMVNTTVSNETLSCRFADGAMVPVTFAGGQYSSTRGGGIYRDYSLLESREDWTGGFEFDGGPFANARGFLRIDKEGRRRLDIGVTTSTTRGYWYSSTETTPVAECLSSVPTRRIPIYGRQAAPRTGVTSGPSGQFTAQRYIYNGNGVNTINTVVYTFTPDGWFTDDDPTYPAIDCSRTLPSGAPRCSAYQLSPGRIKMQDEPGTWGQAAWESLKITATELDIGGTSYPRIAPLTGVKLSGVYTTQSGSSSGSITGVLTTIVTEGTYVFQADGTFKAASSLFSRIGIGPSIGGGGVMGASSNNNNQSSTGRYRIDGNWLVLTTSDGREARVFVHTGGADDTPRNQSPEYLHIDGSLYSREK
jgi:hypothetical protein